MSAVLRQPERRDGFERRDERTEQWLADVDRRRGPRRFQEISAARVADLECGPAEPMSVADRNPTLHPIFAGICGAHGL